MPATIKDMDFTFIDRDDTTNPDRLYVHVEIVSNVVTVWLRSAQDTGGGAQGPYPAKLTGTLTLAESVSSSTSVSASPSLSASASPSASSSTSVSASPSTSQSASPSASSSTSASASASSSPS